MDDGETPQVLSQMLTEEGKQTLGEACPHMGLSVFLERQRRENTLFIGPGNPRWSVPLFQPSLRGCFPGCCSLAFLVFPFATSVREINSFARPYINRKASC